MTIIRVGPLLIAVEKKEASVEGRELQLTELEFSILIELARNVGKTYPPAELLSVLPKAPATQDALIPHISRLRTQLAEFSKGVLQLRIVPKTGFRLEKRG